MQLLPCPLNTRDWSPGMVVPETIHEADMLWGSPDHTGRQRTGIVADCPS